MRPDLFDAHTLHWHGFRNVIPFFDGEPTGLGVGAAGTVFRYVYRPREPGTYMFHCHVEDVEHVHMGMNGLVFVRPALNVSRAQVPVQRRRRTEYDREFALHLSEVWAESHWADAHIQLPEWSDYHADFALLNGRVTPTRSPRTLRTRRLGTRAAVDEAVHAGRRSTWTGHWCRPADSRTSSTSRCRRSCSAMAGERVALRFSNLGFKEAAMTIDGITMHVVGRDATLMGGRDGTDTSYHTNTINFNAGESFDVIIDAPPFTGGIGSSGHGLRRLHALQPLVPAGQQPCARWVRRSSHRDPGLSDRAPLPTQTVPNT